MKRIFRYFMVNFVKITGYIPLALWLKPRVYRENPSERKTKSAEIVVANHTTLLDFVMLLMLYGFRVIRVFMAEVLFRNKLCGWFLHQMHGIRVDRNSPDKSEAMNEARNTLNNSGVVGIFPEGRLNPEGKNFGSLLPFSMGSVYLSITTGARIRPVYLYTNGGILKSSAILVGEPIDMQSLFGKDPTPQALAQANQYLKNRIEKLRDDLKLRVAHKSESLVTRHIRWSMAKLIPIAFRPTYHYTDPSVQQRRLGKPTILVSNHTAYYDPPMLCTAFGKDRLHMIAAEVLFEKKLLAWLLNRLGCIKVDRTRLDMDSMHAISTTLAKGESVGIFPEGHVSEDGELHEFKAGFILSAMTSGAQVLPVYISGEYKYFRKSLHIWIDIPMTIDPANMTPDGIRFETQRVYDRMLYLKQQANKYAEENRNG